MRVEDQFDKSQLRYLQLLLDAGCKIKFKTFIAGKQYVWMTDRGGKYFLEPLPVEETHESFGPYDAKDYL